MRLNLLLCLWLLESCMAASAQDSKKVYDSYKGLVMAGYQGWFNTPGDSADLGWRHYGGHDGFKPGSCGIDLWPDVAEYKKVYQTAFSFDDGSPAYTFSSNDKSTVDVHFRWMREYGLDGVFMQRFLSDIRHGKLLAHFNRVLDSAMESANKYERAICIMYDLSGMKAGDESLLLKDISALSKQYNLYNHALNPSYLYHNGKPLVAVWGIGFNDGRHYGLPEGENIIKGLKAMGFSVMLGVPTFWRELRNDTENDSCLHTLIKQCDIVMPWFVGRYNEDTYSDYYELIRKDLEWTRKNNVDYVPLCYPGFSWGNMKGGGLFIPRNKGSFFWKQLSNVIHSGAEMIYIAMFDEMDEGTAIFKCATQVPLSSEGSYFVPLEKEVGSDYYLRLAGNAGRLLRKKLSTKKK